MTYCRTCAEPSRTEQCADCRRDQRREQELDRLEDELVEVLDDCG